MAFSPACHFAMFLGQLFRLVEMLQSESWPRPLQGPSMDFFLACYSAGFLDPHLWLVGVWLLRPLKPRTPWYWVLLAEVQVSRAPRACPLPPSQAAALEGRALRRPRGLHKAPRQGARCLLRSLSSAVLQKLLHLMLLAPASSVRLALVQPADGRLLWPPVL